ncbi:uncharacterized protein C8Q71DRAFT_446325 [Rhodofomes roseus]|uniref:F-box domain-containing protein n=1 Tax=Rhodofomes roseus TaxID=34475 RepID=A0ABQ8JY41_9APHY|nr:uncharacterized protein C8Q71DRAFT_446325 [Rhodofomes roseus]KAH9829171.1 hypothetical protein C8Q71DRAFT_446325 [Rhodofomes roseus]
MPGFDSLCDDVLLVLPEHDRAQLQGHTTQQARAWLAAKTRDVQRYLSDLQTAYNSTLTVNALPNEIFVEILRLASASDHRNAWTAKSMGVCRYWRDVIEDTPILWTTIDLSARLQFLELCLMRSNGVGLSIYLPKDARMRRRARKQARIDFSTVAPLLVAHYPRMRSIDLHIDEKNSMQSELLWRLLDAPLPALVSLALVNDGSLRWMPKPFPGLRSLSLTSITVPDWSRLPISQLTSIWLCAVDFPKDGCFASLLELLKACISLECFGYDGLELEHLNGLEPRCTLQLPRLLRFHLSGTQAAILSLLAQVSLPQHACVSLCPGASDSWEPRRGVLDTFLPRDMTQCLPALCEARHVLAWLETDEEDPDVELTIYADVERTEFWESRRWRDPNFHVRLNVWSRPRDPSMPSLYIAHVASDWLELEQGFEAGLSYITRDLCRFLPASVETLILRGITNRVDVKTWTRMMSCFPNIKQLEIMGQSCDILCFPRALRPTRSRIPCRHLRELVLRYRPRKQGGSLEMLEELRVALEKRMKDGSRLESLTLLVQSTKSDKRFPPKFVVDQLPVDVQERLLDLKPMAGSMVVRWIACHDDEHQYDYNNDDYDGPEDEDEDEEGDDCDDGEEEEQVGEHLLRFDLMTQRI